MFRKINDNISVSPQITLEDVAAAKAEGVSLIINNRPDGEDPSAPQSADIEAAARDAGMWQRWTAGGEDTRPRRLSGPRRERDRRRRPGLLRPVRQPVHLPDAGEPVVQDGGLGRQPR